MAIAFSRSGRLIATGARDCTIRVFDSQNGKPAGLYSGQYGDIISLDFSPDEKFIVSTSNRQIVSTSNRQQVRVWNLSNGTSKNINHHTASVTAARYSPSGRWIASASYDNTVVVSHADTGKQLVALTYRNTLFSLEIVPTPRGVLMATGSEAGDVNVMLFFEDANDVYSYAASFLRDNLAIENISSRVLARPQSRATP